MNNSLIVGLAGVFVAILTIFLILHIEGRVKKLETKILEDV